jgi:two-component system, OmpR family, sensor histidine kinase TctE
MATKFRSIQKDLLLWLLIPLATLIVLDAFLNYQQALSFADNAFDDGLAETARAIAGQVEYEDGGWTLASPDLSNELMTHDDHEKIYFLVTDNKGKFIGGNPTVGLPHYSKNYPYYYNGTIHHKSVRIVTIKVPLHHLDKATFMFVQMAETLQDREKLAQNILIRSITNQLLFLCLAAFFVWVGVTKGLSPLQALCKDISKRSALDLSPLSLEYSPLELHLLIQSFNDLMMRIEGFISAQKRFIANAAHQLRTPLAGLQAQIELLLRTELPPSTHHALRQIEVSTNRTNHLVQQLLMLSRAEADVLASYKFQPVNLVELARRICEDFVPYSVEKQIDFGFETSCNELIIDGDQYHLTDLISNLIDNALAYTPKGGKVTVFTKIEQDSIQFLVEDSGPGIPLPEREKVFERFYRLKPGEGIGSGLGLSIVYEIAKAHNASIQVHDSENTTGIRISVHFTNACSHANEISSSA